MRRKRIRKNANANAEIITFLVCTVMLFTLLFLSSGKTFESTLTSFAAPHAQNTEIPKETSPVKVTLTPQETPKSDVSKSTGNITLNLSSRGEPTILIYHTHTLEAYTPTEKYPYTEHGGSWRTDDNTRNVVTVGELLAEQLRSYGFNVIHDITNHEPPKLSTAYERSLQTMESYKKKYPSLTMFIDLHRDATGEDNTDDFCIIDGEKTARVMFVVGTGKGATGTGFSQTPDFDSNYSYAASVTEYLRSVHPELVREIRVKTGRYNQHVSNCCMLIEIGHNMNTLEEALAAAKHVAAGIANLASYET